MSIQTPLNMTATLDLLPPRVKKQILKNLVGQINQSIIGYARAHLRQQQFAVAGEIPTIDDYNDLRAREQEARDNDHAVADMGFDPTDKAIIQCMRFVTLRDWFELQIMHSGESITFDPLWDAPFSLENSLDWNIQRAPRFDDAEITKLAAAIGRSFDQLRAAQMAAANDDRKDLIANRDAVLALYEECSTMVSKTIPYTLVDKVDDGQGNEVEHKRTVQLEPLTDAADIEILIASLPLQSQWRLAIRFHDLMLDAVERSIKLMLRPRGLGSRDAVGDIRLIDDARAVHYGQLAAFFAKFGERLIEIAIERNIFLPELPEPVSQPIVVAMDAQRAADDEIALAASELRDASSLEQPLQERLMRRALAPDQATTQMQAALARLNSKRLDDGPI